MKLVITETIDNVVEIKTLETIINIADFDVGLRQMLEAEQSTTITATGNIILTDSDKVIQIINPGGVSRDITLPAVSINNHGFLFINTASGETELLIIKSSSGSIIASVYRSGAGWFLSSGISWYSAGLGTIDPAGVEATGQTSGNIPIDFTKNLLTCALSGNPTFLSQNLNPGATVAVRITCDATLRTFTFPAGWKFLVSKPLTILASNMALLSLTSFDTTDSGVIAAYGPETA